MQKKVQLPILAKSESVSCGCGVIMLPSIMSGLADFSGTRTWDGLYKMYGQIYFALSDLSNTRTLVGFIDYFDLYKSQDWLTWKNVFAKYRLN